jgi:hypothetical protein
MAAPSQEFYLKEKTHHRPTAHISSLGLGFIPAEEQRLPVHIARTRAAHDAGEMPSTQCNETYGTAERDASQWVSVSF